MHSRLLVSAFLAAFTLTAAAQTALARPKITTISHLAIYTADPTATDHYYREIVGAEKLPDPQDPKAVRYAFSTTQFVDVLPLPPGSGVNRLDHIAWNTNDVEGLRKYLSAKAWKTPEKVEKGSDGSRWFAVKDPEGNKVEFVQPPRVPRPVPASAAIGHHIIHIGILVHDRALEDTFYRDLLGFRPYWFGGMKEGRIDWVSQQAPDSHDWLEYMLEYRPAGGASGISQQQLGVLDHLSIGEVSVPEAYKVLEAGNRLTGKHDAAPKIGLDGKYQFNMYDPDGIRLELMNFHATNKPCCSPFTAEDPAK
jgi:catechol 2,3-dioxygenase-like lactoylglutathione lyase family enzyme